MHRVVESGTARRYARDPAIAYCGKTGTAQTASRRVDGRVVRSGDTAWFVGFAPYRIPRIAFAVMVEYAQEGGGRVSGPKGLEVLRRCRAFGYLD
jgi:penicillin-binding protein 2